MSFVDIMGLHSPYSPYFAFSDQSSYSKREKNDKPLAVDDFFMIDNDNVDTSDPSVPSDDLDDLDDFVVFEGCEEGEDLQQRISMAVTNIKSGDLLKGATVSTYVEEVLQKREGFSFIVVTDFLADKAEQVADKVENVFKDARHQGKLLIFPLVLSGNFSPLDHIVALTIDPQTRTYEYYDPKGASLSDHKDRVIKNKAEKHSLGDFLNFMDVQSEDGVSNGSKHQAWSNTSDCGAFVLNFINERVESAFASVCQPRNLDPTLIRQGLANDLEALQPQ